MDGLDDLDWGIPSDVTDISSLPNVTSYATNPSVGLNTTSLLSQLIGGATQVATANQIAQGGGYLPTTLTSGNALGTLEAGTGLSGSTLAIIGIVFVALIMLRH